MWAALTMALDRGWRLEEEVEEQTQDHPQQVLLINLLNLVIQVLMDLEVTEEQVNLVPQLVVVVVVELAQ